MPRGLDGSEYEGFEGGEPEMSEEDLQVLNQMRPDLLRQWMIDMMLRNGALQEFNNPDAVVLWADHFEQYILHGKKDTP